MTDLEAKIVSDQLMTDLVVVTAEFDKTFIIGKDQLVQRPILEVELVCEGRKRSVRRSVIYSFCPFCGKAYDALPESPFDENKEVQP